MVGWMGGREEKGRRGRYKVSWMDERMTDGMKGQIAKEGQFTHKWPEEEEKRNDGWMIVSHFPCSCPQGRSIGGTYFVVVLSS